MRLLSIQDVMHKTTLSKACIYRLITQGEFPRGTRISARRVGWLEEQVDSFIARMFGPVLFTGDAP